MVRSPPFTLPYGFGAARGVTEDRHPQCSFSAKLNLNFDIYRLRPDKEKEKGDARASATVSSRLQHAAGHVRQATVLGSLPALPQIVEKGDAAALAAVSARLEEGDAIVRWAAEEVLEQMEP